MTRPPGDASPSSFERILAALGLLAAAVISAANLSAEWVFAFVPHDLRPMAPAAAIFTIVLVACALWIAARPHSSVAGWVAAVLSVLVAMAAGLTYLQHAWNPAKDGDWESIVLSRFTIDGKFQHMASLASGLLILLAFSIVTLTPLVRSRRLRMAGLAAAVVVGVLAVAMGISCIAALTLILSLGVTISAAVSVAMALVGWSLALLLGFRRAVASLIFGDTSEASSPAATQLRRSIGVMFVALTIIVPLAGALYLRDHVRQVREDTATMLSSVASLRSEAIANWYAERIADSSTLASMPFVSATLLAHMGDPAAPPMPPPEMLASYLKKFRTNYGYRAVGVFTSDLKVVTLSPDGKPPPADQKRALALQAMAQRKAVPAEADHSGRCGLCLDFAAPVITPDGRILGAVWVSIDASNAISKIVAGWPMRTETAETLLVESKGPELVFRTPSRFASDLAGTSVPMNPPSVETRAVLTHSRVLSEDKDRRGRTALAIAAPVRGTPWYVVAKIDAKECYREAASEALTVVVGLVLVLAVVFAAAALLWRRTHYDLIRKRWEAERLRLETSDRRAAMMQQANDGVLIIDGSATIVDVNERALAMYGYRRDEMLGLSVAELRDPASRPQLSGRSLETTSPEGVVFETIHKKKDGTTFAVEVSSRVASHTGEHTRISLVRDITERKAQQAQLARLGRMYQALSEINEAVAHATDGAALRNDVCRILVEAGGFKMTWIGRPDDGHIVPEAHYGDESNYVEGIRVSTAEEAEGRGPTGAAYRTGRAVVFNDFLHDPLTNPWQARAAASGLFAALGVPLYCRGEVTGVLTVYAGEMNFFGDREIALVEKAAEALSFAFDVLVQNDEKAAAVAALEAGENRLRLLVSATPAIIYTCRLGDFATTFMSENVSSVLGYTPRDFFLTPRFWLDRVHPDDLTRALEESGPLADDGYIVREYRFRHADGRYLWMRDELRVVRDGSGNPSMMAGCWLDITQKKAAEEALQIREEIFAAIVEKAEDAMTLFDIESQRFVEYNSVAHETLGYTREEFATLTLYDLLADESEREAAREYLSRPDCEQFEREVRHRTRTGDVRYARLHVTPLTLRGTRYIAATWNDVTERRAVEAERRKLSSAVEQNAASIVITDLASNIEYVNPRFTESSGYTLEDVRGRNPRVLKSGLTAPEVYVDLWSTITSGKVWRGEIVNRRKTGEIYTEMVVIAPVSDAEGKPTHYVGVKEDITKRKQIEAALRESEERYRLIAENTRDMIWLGDLRTGKVLYASPATLTVLGIAAEEVVGTDMCDAMAAGGMQQYLAGELPALVAAFRRGDESARHRVKESELRRTDGAVIWAEIITTILTDEAGQPDRLLGVARDISLRHQAEVELRKLSSAVEQAPVSIVITDLTGTIEYVNPNFSRLTGYSREEAIGQNPRVLKSGETPPQVYEEMWQTLVAGKVWRGELHNRRKSGEVFVELAVIAPVTNDSGEITHYVAVKEDITARKQAEVALRRSEEHYRLITENTVDAIWLYSISGKRFTYFSPAILTLLGYTPEEAVTKQMTDLVPPEAYPLVTSQLAERIAAVQAGDESRRTELNVLDNIRKDNSHVPVEITSTVLEDADGSFHILGVTRDISERVRATKSEELYRLIAEHTSDVIWIYDLVGNAFRYVSPSVTKVLGVSPAELVGKGLGTVLTPESFVIAMQSLTGRIAAFEAGDESRRSGLVLLDHRRPDGGIIHGEVVASLLPDANGKVTQLLGVSRDITERLRAAEELQRSRDRLEEERNSLAQRVEERTADLRHLNVELASAARAKDEFLANMSHELRTPLNAILALSETLLEEIRGPLNARQRSSVNTIHASGRHLLDLITDILDLSKVEAGRMDLQVEPVLLSDTCEASIAFVRELASKKSLTLSNATNERNITVRADQRRLKQMLVNLLSNAVKFTPEGGEVRLETNADPAAGVVRISVRDTGIGMSKEDIGRLFQPFVQLDSSLSRQHEGTGLGLALVRRLAELHDGSVSVESEPGVGSCFTITLPWSPQDEPARLPEKEAETAAVVPPCAVEIAHTPKILLADDGEFNIIAIGDYLVDLGYDVSVARNGEEAVEMAEQLRPDLILMDVQMPRMDGLEATRILRTKEGFARLPIIALTGMAMAGDRERCLSAGASDYLTKPVSPKTLVETMKRHLSS